MPDRVLRDEIWQSDRFLDLPTDACRLTFLRFLSESDDFGNLEGGLKRLFRMLQVCTQIKSEAATAATLEALIDADLIRMYSVGGRELIHLPRNRPHRQYLVRKMPKSPWDADVQLGKERRITARGLAKDEENQRTEEKRSNDVVATSLPYAYHVAEGVGVGVGVGEEKNDLAVVTAPRAEDRRPDCPHLEILALWAEVLPQASRHLASQWRGTRAAHLRARWREVAVEKEWTDTKQGLAWLRKFFGYVGASPFLMGHVQGRNGGRAFDIELEWLVNPQNWAKVREGKYHAQESTA